MRIKLLVASAVSAALCLVVVAPASATPAPAIRTPSIPAALPVPGGTVTGPVRYPSSPLSYAPGVVCSFGVHETFPVDQVIGWTYTQSDGFVAGQYFKGALVGHITRDGTGKSVDVNIGGQGVWLYGRDGSTTIFGDGPYQVGFKAGDHPSTDLTVVSGLSLLYIAPSNTKTLIFAGSVTNVCAELS